MQQLREEMNWVAEAIKELSKRQVRAEVTHINKWLLREEVAEKRGASAKRTLSEVVLQQREKSFTHPSIHPSIPSFIDSWVHGFMDALIHWFIDSLIHGISDSLTH